MKSHSSLIAVWLRTAYRRAGDCEARVFRLPAIAELEREAALKRDILMNA
jgi:hypothetical protein